MQTKALRNFAHAGAHVQTGDLLETDPDSARYLAGMGRVLILPDEAKPQTTIPTTPAPRRKKK